jgi:hypothetical protein
LDNNIFFFKYLGLRGAFGSLSVCKNKGDFRSESIENEPHTFQKKKILSPETLRCRNRETREGWPLLTVETEANGDLWSQMKGILPWLVIWAVVPVQEPALAALHRINGDGNIEKLFLRCSQQYKIFFSLPSTFSLYVPHRLAIWAGSRAVACLSLSMCLCVEITRIQDIKNLTLECMAFINGGFYKFGPRKPDLVLSTVCSFNQV